MGGVGSSPARDMERCSCIRVHNVCGNIWRSLSPGPGDSTVLAQAKDCDALPSDSNLNIRLSGTSPSLFLSLSGLGVSRRCFKKDC